MPRISTAGHIAELYPETKGFIREYVDWSPSVRFDTLLINAAGVAIANGQQMFNVAARVNLPAVCNLERAGEVPYPMLIIGWSWQLIYDPAAGVAPNIADALIALDNLEFVFIKDQREYPSWPATAVPGAGGINAMESNNAAASPSNVSNGQSNNWRMLYNPIAIDIKQNFSLLVRSRAVGAPVVALNMRFSLLGLEARRPN